MSFEFLDFINALIVEETEDLPSQQLVAETHPQHLPTDERVGRFRNITHNALTKHSKARLAESWSRYEAHKQHKSLYHLALKDLPESIEQIFQQILEVVTSGGDAVPKSWTMAHREELAGKNTDEEIKKIWVRMYMLGFIDNRRPS